MVLSASAVRHSHSTQSDSFALLDQKSQKISRWDISFLILSFHFSPGRIDKQSRKTSIPVKIWRERTRPRTSRRSCEAYDAKAVFGAFTSANTFASSGLGEAAAIVSSGRSLATINPSIYTSNLSTALVVRMDWGPRHRWALKARTAGSLLAESELLLRGNLLLAFIPFIAAPFFAGLVSPSSTALARGGCRLRFVRLGIRGSRVLRPSLRAFNSGTLRMLVRFGE